MRATRISILGETLDGMVYENSDLSIVVDNPNAVIVDTGNNLVVVPWNRIACVFVDK